MRHRRQSILSLSFLLLVSLSVPAQEFLYDVDFCLNFDNRESNHPYAPSSTLFGLRLTPQIGVGCGDSIVGDHRLMAGVSYVQPFGADWRSARVYPTVYYRYAQAGFNLHFGFVPYTRLFAPLPQYMMSDERAFLYPNIQGTLLQYRDHRGYVEFLCDWRGMMQDSTREAFRLIADGRYQYQWFYLGGSAQMNHLSHSEHILGVCDDVMISPLLGVDFSSYTPLDELSLSMGYLFSWQRDRRANLSFLSHSLEAELALRWRFIGVRSQLHFGGNAMPFYSQYGILLNQGDPCYQARLYNRTDFRLYMIRLPFVTAYVGWNLLYVQGYGLSNQQQVVCHFNLAECVDYIHQKKSVKSLTSYEK